MVSEHAAPPGFFFGCSSSSSHHTISRVDLFHSNLLSESPHEHFLELLSTNSSETGPRSEVQVRTRLGRVRFQTRRPLVSDVRPATRRLYNHGLQTSGEFHCQRAAFPF